ncbi:hypothetical protein KC19_4G159500 [Ceratodon purpureus]|uniref:Ycf49-like protein n=1 Tax=Ceratodon purpureus TaxID=3225 RepID=A0A8T0I994_CERPU|nr:hypothetical protein KC19_4G159500 [Ceratodon purpureus]
MATLPSLLHTKSSSLFSPTPGHSLRRFQASKNALIRHNSPQCSLHSHDPVPLLKDSPSPASVSSSRAELDRVLVPSGQSGRTWVGLDGRAGCVLGLGAVAGAMVAFPHHANAAEVASSLDAWSALVASEPKNALSMPTWVIHVASVAECRVPLPCRMLESVFGSREVQSSFRETELTNALSLPTWFIHVASVVEWITAMALVWQYGDTPGNSTWKGLSWGMVPLLGGAMCACTWHFFYNAQSLEALVVLQAALTVIGNCTMWIAAFRIYQASQKQSKSS